MHEVHMIVDTSTSINLKLRIRADGKPVPTWQECEQKLNFLLRNKSRNGWNHFGLIQKITLLSAKFYYVHCAGTRMRGLAKFQWHILYEKQGKK